MIKALNALSGLIEKVTSVACLILFLLANILLFISVLNRNIFSLPMAWYYELVQTIICWFVSMAFTAAAAKFQLIAIPFLLCRLPVEKRKIPLIIIYIFSFFMSLLVFIYGVRLTGVGMNKYFSILPITMAVPYSAIPTFGILLCIVFLNGIVRFAQGLDIEKYR